MIISYLKTNLNKMFANTSKGERVCSAHITIFMYRQYPLEQCITNRRHSGLLFLTLHINKIMKSIQRYNIQNLSMGCFTALPLYDSSSGHEPARRLEFSHQDSCIRACTVHPI